MVGKMTTESNKGPLISVVMPIFNSAETLERSLKSVLNQSYRNFELICVDDGSTDDSLTVVNRLSKKDPRIRVYHQKKSNAGVARNLGIEMSCGEYITFIDSDDEFMKGGLENLVLGIENERSPVARAGAIEKKNSQNCWLEWILNSRYLEYDYLMINKDPNDFFYCSSGCPWSMIVRRDFIVENGICFSDSPCTEDIMFTYESYIKAGIVKIIPTAVIIHNYSHNIQVSMN